MIEIIGGARAGAKHELEDPELVRFGRHPECEVQFDPLRDRDASSRHAVLVRRDERWILRDLGSANGTRLVDERGATRLDEIALADRAEVEFGAGGPRCRFRFDPDTVRDAQTPVGQNTPGPTRAAPRPQPSTGGRTRALLALLQARQGRSIKLLALGLGIALAATGFALVVVVHHAGRTEESIRKDLVEAMGRLPSRGGANADAEALAQRIEALNRELGKARARGAGGSAVAKAAREAVYLIAARSGIGDEEGFCTAFAIAPGELATNAHCVVLAESLRRHGARIVAVKNGDGRMRLEVKSMRRSPDYVPGRGAITPDVGLFKVADPLTSMVGVADRATLTQLAPGDVIYTYGFPGRLADTAAPEATFVEGVVGRITRLDGSAGGYDDSVLIQHSAFTAGGTSGSPIFDASGKVVAVNAGGYVEDDALEVKDPRSGRPGQLVVAQALAGYNFGMRIDLVAPLLKESAP